MKKSTTLILCAIILCTAFNPVKSQMSLTGQLRTRTEIRNGLGNLEVRCENAFDLLRRLESEGVTFDVVVIDPPAFAKTKGIVYVLPETSPASAFFGIQPVGQAVAGEQQGATPVDPRAVQSVPAPVAK